MRKQFITTVTDLFEKDDKCVLLLGDIGVFGFSSLAEKYPDRVINMGICEQATIGVASGMAKEGLHPIFYTIAPFAVERCLEQIKIDIGYQNLPVTIVSVGASYDYAGLGCTHHCPADISLLKTIPNISIFAPSYKEDVDSLLKGRHGKEAIYMRLPNDACDIMNYVLDIDRDILVLAFGETVDNVKSACEGLEVYILPSFIASKQNPPVYLARKKVIIIEPWYVGTMHYDIQSQYKDSKVFSIGVPRQFLTNYGTKQQHDHKYGLDIEGLRKQITDIINE